MPQHDPTADLFGRSEAKPPPDVVGYVLVAPERGVDVGEGLTYALPAALDAVTVGQRVIVPLGRGDREVAGFVLERTERNPLPAEKAKKIKPVLRIDDLPGAPVSLPADLVKLARWIASYYCCPLGMVFPALLPAAVRHGTGTVTRTLVALPEQPPPPPPPAPEGSPEGSPESVKITKLQRKVMEALAQAAAEGEGWVEQRTLADIAGAKSITPIKKLLDHGLLRSKHAQEVSSDLDLRAQRELEPTGRLRLSPQQQKAVDHLIEHLSHGFSVHLVHGVTGSGKTEVYLRAIERVVGGGVGGEKCAIGDVASGMSDDATPALTSHIPDTPCHIRPSPNRQSPTPNPPPGVIVLVPEIALTPQTVGRFLARFGSDSVAVLHSGLTQAQRHAQWQRIRRGEAHIVVGARSAIFAPLPNLRLIIVDEEHEPSYKQDQLPRYHARDVAIKRGQLLDIPVVLGSATPSLESYANATGFRSQESAVSSQPSRFHLVELPDRVPGMRLPTVEIVDMVEERRSRRGVHLISQRLERELHIVLGRDRRAVEDTDLPNRRPDRAQAILLLNRRGYANYIACPDHKCGWMMRCAHCDTTMVYHRDGKLPAGGVVRCHHCDAEQLLPNNCPQCGNRVTVFGLGVQRVEEELERKFPGVRAIRMDSDTMRTARHYQEALDQFRRGEADVLLGTQMIAKGLDFPGVRLVGVISADTSLHLPDFRAAERTFQLISQVSGRSGRSDLPGKVIVQTFSADDPVIDLAARHDYPAFARQELALRAEVGLPPSSRMARIVIRNRDHVKAVSEARQLMAHLQQFNHDLGDKVRLRGPVPCAIARIADHHRLQIEMLAAPPAAAATLQQLMTALRNSKLLISDATTAVDVDPVALL